MSPDPPSVTVVSLNYAPEPIGIGVYSAGLARHLRAMGWPVRVLAGFPHYPQWRKSKDDRGVLYRTDQDVDGISVTRCYVFVPARPTVLRRIAHELSFTFFCALRYAFSRRTDLTIVASPPLALAFLIALLGRFKRSRTIVHVQDLQPDAAIELGMLRCGRLTRMLHIVERWTYRLASAVSTISSAMEERIAAKGVPHEKLILFRNWAHSDAVVPGSHETPLRREWALGDKFVVLYAGAIGRKQGLEILLDAAEQLRNRPEFVFVIVGDGGERAALEHAANARGLTNVSFRPLQPIGRLGELLATANASVITQRPGCGDFVLPSKLGNILASGRPVVAAAAPGTELSRIVTSARCGLIANPGDAAGLSQALLRLHRDPREAMHLGANGRQLIDRWLGEQPILTTFTTTLHDVAQDLHPAFAPHRDPRTSPDFDPRTARDL